MDTVQERSEMSHRPINMSIIYILHYNEREHIRTFVLIIHRNGPTLDVLQYQVNPW